MPSVRIVYLPPGPSGAKVGLDDYLNTGPAIGLYQHFRDMAKDNLLPVPAEGAGTSVKYEKRPDGMVWLRQTKDGPVPTPLTNFTAEIVTDVAEDDGAEVRHIFEIEAQIGERVRRFHVSAERFESMNWAIEHLGAQAVVYAGFGVTDHARVATQLLSTNVVERRIYTHLGWRQSDGTWVYLHAGGAIGPQGLATGVEVRLSEVLSRFELPIPPVGDHLVDAIHASLKFLDIGPDRVTVPGYSAMVRAVMATADFSVLIAGKTGAGKTALAALLQQHSGSGLDADHLPASWSSTGNALEGLAFQAKDALLLIDDLAPTGSQSDIQRLHKEADRVLRAQGNRSGRQRMRPDGSLRPPKPPRGLILSTGEDVPRGQSLRARFLVVELKNDDLNWDRVTACQGDAANGLFAQALAGFVRFLATRYAQVLEDLRTEMSRRRRAAAGSAIHRRVPTIVANLQVALDYWLEYAQDAGALTKSEADGLWDRALTALNEVAKAQEEHQEGSEPTRRFLELISAALASGRAHVASISGTPPTAPAEAWGWRWGVGEGPNEPRPYGERIGWIDGDDLFLEPEASYAVAQRLARDSGDSITVGSKTLHKRLHERSMLASTDDRRHKLTVRHVLEGRRRAVLHLKADLISAPERAQ